MLNNIKYYIRESWLLLVSSFIFGLIVAIPYIAWQPRIESNKSGKLGKQVNEITGQDCLLKAVEGELKIDEKTVTQVYEIKNSSDQFIGFAFQASGPAYDIIELAIVVDGKCEKILGYGVLTCNETPGFGDKIKYDFFRSQFRDIPASQLKLIKSGDAAVKDTEILAISGATITSQGVVNIFNNYIEKIQQQLGEKGLLK